MRARLTAALHTLPYIWRHELTTCLHTPTRPPLPSLPDVEPGQLRLLEVDERLVLPTNSLVRLLVTSADVIHSWAVPSLGVKIDAIPGRLNQVGGGVPLGWGEYG